MYYIESVQRYVFYPTKLIPFHKNHYFCALLKGRFGVSKMVVINKKGHDYEESCAAYRSRNVG